MEPTRGFLLKEHRPSHPDFRQVPCEWTGSTCGFPFAFPKNHQEKHAKGIRPLLKGTPMNKHVFFCFAFFFWGGVRIRFFVFFAVLLFSLGGFNGVQPISRKLTAGDSAPYPTRLARCWRTSPTRSSSRCCPWSSCSRPRLEALSTPKPRAGGTFSARSCGGGGGGGGGGFFLVWTRLFFKGGNMNMVGGPWVF